MNIFISHFSALNFYRNARANNILEIVNNKGNNILGSDIYTPEVNKWTIQLTNYQPNSKQKTTTKDITKQNIPCLDQDCKIDILVARKSNLNNTNNVRYHVCTNSLPRYSFIKVANGICVSSPELLFFQLSNIYSIEEMMYIGMELCGTYTIHKTDYSNFYSNILPLTTVDRINRYLSSLKNYIKYTNGLLKAMEAAKCLENSAASPRESMLYLMLCAPRKYGGYGIKGLVLNHKIKLSQKAANILGYKIMRPDLCNPANKIAIEYDSTAYHENAEQNKHDKLRLNALHNDG